jgi:hypothetical protein
MAKRNNGLPKTTEACLERKGPTPEEMANVAAHPEVPNEEAEVETVAALEDLYGGRHLAVWRRRQPKKRTQGDGGPGRGWSLPAKGRPAG